MKAENREVPAGEKCSLSIQDYKITNLEKFFLFTYGFEKICTT